MSCGLDPSLGAGSVQVMDFSSGFGCSVGALCGGSSHPCQSQDLGSPQNIRIGSPAVMAHARDLPVVV